MWCCFIGRQHLELPLDKLTPPISYTYQTLMLYSIKYRINTGIWIVVSFHCSCCVFAVCSFLLWKPHGELNAQFSVKSVVRYSQKLLVVFFLSVCVTSQLTLFVLKFRYSQQKPFQQKVFPHLSFSPSRIFAQVNKERFKAAKLEMYTQWHWYDLKT